MLPSQAIHYVKSTNNIKKQVYRIISPQYCLLLFQRNNDMTIPLEDYYLRFPEPYQGCLLALKLIILSVDEHIIHERKFQIPNFSYKGKKLGFLWMNRKKLIVGFITDKSILPSVEGRRKKDQLEMIQIDPNADLPKEMIIAKLQEIILLYQ